MTDAQKNAVRSAFAYYAKLINVTFTEVAGDGTGNINFGTNSQASSAGYATLPNSSDDKDKAYLYLANNQATNGDAGLQEGGYGWLTVLHEIGHTLGLKHPGNYNAGGGGTPGPYLSASEDDHQHTIMSYHDNNVSRGVNATTPMPYDVAALQYLYGANTNASTAAGGAFTFTGASSYLRTLWSANGADTIDLSQLTHASNVDLNAGAFSSINITAPVSSTFYSGNANVGLAYGSKINNVTLSSTTGVTESITFNNAFASGAYDSIASFDATDDKINLKKALFGALSAKNIEFGTVATKSTSKIVVNNSTGEIFFDADGSGKAVAKKIAQYTAVQGRGTISASNFSFVA
jgi:serralysin